NYSKRYLTRLHFNRKTPSFSKYAQKAARMATITKRNNSYRGTVWLYKKRKYKLEKNLRIKYMLNYRFLEWNLKKDKNKPKRILFFLLLNSKIKTILH